ncbi:hypothetical protein GCM10027341_12590 [Spirosoma knui]
MTVQGAGSGASYNFSGGDVQSSGPNSRTATVTQPGNYTVQVTNSLGCPASATTTIESNTAVPRNLALSVSNELTCAQTTATLSASSSNGGVSYVISGPGNQTYNASTAVVNQPGEYTVVATRNNGCTAVQTTIVESNTTAPENVTLTNNGPLTCAQTSAQLTAASSTTGSLSYSFTGGSPITQDGSSFATISNGGTYTVTVTGPNGCTASATTTVESNTVAPQNVTLSSSGTLTCAQTNVNLLADSNTEGDTYSIAGPGGFNYNGPSTSVNQPGTYTVTATGTNGCTAVQTTTVESNTTAPENVTLINNGPLSFTNTSVTLSATEGQGYSYSFSNGAVYPGSGNTATVTTAGVYSVTVTRQDNGCSSIASTTVLGGNNPTVCRGGTAVISVAVEGDPVKYEWYKNSLSTPKIMETPQLFRGTATSSLTLINAQSNTQGNFFLKVTDRSGSVKVYGPYRLTVNAGCRAREIANLETLLQVELAPNPIQQDRLRAIVRGAEGRSLQVELINLSGKPIRQQRWSQAQSQQLIDWDMQGQVSGMYLLQVVSEGSAGLPTQRLNIKVVKP